MNKSTIGAIAAGIGISAVAMGVIGAKKMNQKHRMAHRVMALKNEFASDAGMMAKKAGHTLIKVGRNMNKMAR